MSVWLSGVCVCDRVAKSRCWAVCWLEWYVWLCNVCMCGIVMCICMAVLMCIQRLDEWLMWLLVRFYCTMDDSWMALFVGWVVAWMAGRMAFTIGIGLCMHVSGYADWCVWLYVWLFVLRVFVAIYLYGCVWWVSVVLWLCKWECMTMYVCLYGCISMYQYMAVYRSLYGS